MQPAERVLHFLQLTDERRGDRKPAFGCDLQTVSQLLGGNPDTMQPLRVVHLPRICDRRRERLRPLRQSRGQCVPPLLGLRFLKRLGDRRQPPIELVDLHLLQPLQHRRRGDAPAPRLTWARTSSRARRRQGVALRRARRARSASRPAPGPSQAPWSACGSCRSAFFALLGFTSRPAPAPPPAGAARPPGPGGRRSRPLYRRRQVALECSSSPAQAAIGSNGTARGSW